MSKKMVWWYGVCTIISSLLQNLCRGVQTEFAQYIVGGGDVASTLLLSTLMWSLSEGVGLTLVLVWGVIKEEQRNLVNYRREFNDEE